MERHPAFPAPPTRLVRCMLLCFWAVLLVRAPARAAAPHPGTIESRASWIISDIAKYDHDVSRFKACGYWVARLFLNQDVDYALERIDRALNDNNTEAFDLFYCIAAYLVVGDKYTQAMKDKMPGRMGLWDYSKLAYCSDNYRFLTYAAGYLAGQEFPGMRDKGGHSGSQMVSMCRDKLYHEFDYLTDKGMSEYGSIQYSIFTHNVCRVLYEYADDPGMQQRALMCLEWLNANWALDWNQSAIVATTTRAKGDGLLTQNPSFLFCHATIAYMYYGAHRAVEDINSSQWNGVSTSTFFSCFPGAYELPDVMKRIGRKTTYEFRKSNLAEEPCRHWPTVIRRTTFIRPAYGMSSEMSFDTDGGEATRTYLSWHSDQPASVMWIHRPFNSDLANVIYRDNAHAHRIMQHRYTMAGVANGGQVGVLEAIMPANGAIKKRVESDGWVFCHAGSMLFALRFAKPASWYDKTGAFSYAIRKSSGSKNAYVLETAELEPYTGGGTDAELERFKQDVLTNATFSYNDGAPSIRYVSIHGYTVEMIYKSTAKVDGEIIDYDAFKLIDSPWMQQEANGDVMTLSEGGGTRTYDFSTWTITSNDIVTAGAAHREQALRLTPPSVPSGMVLIEGVAPRHFMGEARLFDIRGRYLNTHHRACGVSGFAVVR